MKKVIILFLLMCPVMAAAQEKVVPKNIPADSLNRDDQDPPDFIVVDKNPELLTPIRPIYPDSARKAHIEGKVVVKVLIDKEGTPSKSQILKNSGTDIFDNAAMQAVMNVKYKPAEQNGKPLKVWMVIPINFKINRDSFFVEKQPEPLTTFHPIYPDTAARSELGGRVDVAVLIDEEGNPLKYEILKISGTSMIDSSAARSVMNVKYKPAEQNGTSCAVYL